MSNTVLEVGTGIVVVTVVWITAVVFGMTLLRASGPAKLGVIPVFLLALTITLVLVFFPRSPETEIPFKEIQRVAEEARHANTQRPAVDSSHRSVTRTTIRCGKVVS
ncbi:transmembrane protein 218 isoform X3 [Notolabrus celidotus]|uniref:transmembrane protein 218 isoform X3 n=1 Tax=Notolabrus celidotus TaxID=1203425 RepID=UPI00148FD45A|nr:transmembrane protein 218 isoform X3 [Notolabrus celidotus]